MQRSLHYSFHNWKIFVFPLIDDKNEPINMQDISQLFNALEWLLAVQVIRAVIGHFYARDVKVV